MRITRSRSGCAAAHAMPPHHPVSHRPEGDVPSEHRAVPEDIAEHDHKWSAGHETQLSADPIDILDAIDPEVVEGATAAAPGKKIRVEGP